MNKEEKRVFFNTTLPTLKPIEIIEHPITEERFIDIFSQVHGQSGVTAYEKEKFYFQKILLDNPKIAECTPLSLFAVFLDVATKGLTLDSSSKALCYITFRNVKKKVEGNGVWEQRAILDISGYGELVLRERAGQVKYADNPEVIYDGEEFRQENTPEGVRIYHTIKYPRPKTGIILLYVRIVRPDESVTFGTLDQEGIQRLKHYSEINNGKWQKGENGRFTNVPGKANVLYGDTGFLKAKCLKHSFQSFAKLKLNNFSALTEGPESAAELGIHEEVKFIQPANEEKEVIPEVKTPEAEPAGITIKDDTSVF